MTAVGPLFELSNGYRQQPHSNTVLSKLITPGTIINTCKFCFPFQKNHHRPFLSVEMYGDLAVVQHSHTSHWFPNIISYTNYDLKSDARLDTLINRAE